MLHALFITLLNLEKDAVFSALFFFHMPVLSQDFTLRFFTLVRTSSSFCDAALFLRAVFRDFVVFAFRRSFLGGALFDSAAPQFEVDR